MPTIDHYYKNFAKKKIILWRIWGDLELKGLESAWGIPADARINIHLRT